MSCQCLLGLRPPRQLVRHCLRPLPPARYWFDLFCVHSFCCCFSCCCFTRRSRRPSRRLSTLPLPTLCLTSDTTCRRETIQSDPNANWVSFVLIWIFHFFLLLLNCRPPFLPLPPPSFRLQCLVSPAIGFRNRKLLLYFLFIWHVNYSKRYAPHFIRFMITSIFIR